MTTSGLIFMAASWAGILALFAYTLVRTLTGKEEL